MKFNEWYIKQAGKRVLWRRYAKTTDTDLRKMVIAGNEAKAELEFRHEWDECKKYALYAWNAQDKD